MPKSGRMLGNSADVSHITLERAALGSPAQNPIHLISNLRDATSSLLERLYRSRARALPLNPVTSTLNPTIR